jgi:hypothetical protein
VQFPRFGIRSWIALVLLCLLLVDVLLTAAAGFKFGFAQDDLMNAHWALTRSWLQLASDCLKFWTVSPVYRPAGVAFVKIIYSASRMNVFEWRWFYGALFCSAILLSFAAAWRLTNRFPVALIAALLMAFYTAFRWLYFSMPFICDVTALIFSSLFFLVWFQAREEGNYLYKALAVGLLICGLQCKEIALDAIVFTALYELIFDPPTSLRRVPSWIAERPLLVICAVVGIVFAVSRLSGNNAMALFPQYHLSLSPSAYISHISAWMRQIYTDPITVRAAWVVLPWLILAIWSSWRLTLWCVLAFCIGVAPVAFIQQRGAQDLFVPSLPLAILVALAFDGLCEAVARIFVRAGRPREIVKCVLVGSVCVLIVLRQGSVKDRQGSFALTRRDIVFERTLEDARNLKPRPGPDSRIVVDSDPLEDFPWGDLFVFRLAFDSPQLQVKRPSQLSDDERRDDDLGRWRHIGWNDGRWMNLGSGKK